MSLSLGLSKGSLIFGSFVQVLDIVVTTKDEEAGPLNLNIAGRKDISSSWVWEEAVDVGRKASTFRRVGITCWNLKVQLVKSQANFGICVHGTDCLLSCLEYPFCMSYASTLLLPACIFKLNPICLLHTSPCLPVCLSGT
jgi:hypothetical protein